MTGLDRSRGQGQPGRGEGRGRGTSPVLGSRLQGFMIHHNSSGSTQRRTTGEWRVATAPRLQSPRPDGQSQTQSGGRPTIHTHLSQRQQVAFGTIPQPQANGHGTPHTGYCIQPPAACHLYLYTVFGLSLFSLCFTPPIPHSPLWLHPSHRLRWPGRGGWLPAAGAAGAE